MADEPEVATVEILELDHDVEDGADIDMAGAEIIEADTGATLEAVGDGMAFEDLTGDEVSIPTRTTFIDYLKSPIIELAVGQDDKVILFAHQALLVQSPFFEEACAKFSDNNSSTKRIELPKENLDAVGCFLEYIYTGEYFPQKLEGSRGLIKEAGESEIDASGERLLKHARVYTLADKLGMGALKALAHSKIHVVNSSATGEIAYARYVYATTAKEDYTIRKPVASFWAQKSHLLRVEAGDEFRQMCLEFPQFGFDVLTRVLDEKAKREGERTSGTPTTGRKRQRGV